MLPINEAPRFTSGQFGGSVRTAILDRPLTHDANVANIPTLMIADQSLWHWTWPAGADRRQRHLYDGYAVQEAGLKRRSTISHSRVEPHDLASFGAASV